MSLRAISQKYSGDSSELAHLHIDSTELQESHRIFIAHSKKLFGLLAMPEEMVGWGLAVAAWRSARHHAELSLATKAVKDKKYGEGLPSFSFSKEDLEKEASALMHNFVPSDLNGAATSQFSELLDKVEDWRHAVKLIKQTLLVHAWTGLESSAKNIWIAAVNSRPMALGHKSFSSLQDDQREAGFTSKMIQVGLIAKYGFDLRQSLGTILSERFDFTSVDGINRTYQGAFGMDSILSQGLLEGTLVKLEKTRNLLVHRAGIVDDTYKRTTQCDQESGTELDVSDADLDIFISASLKATINLFKFADNYLASSNGEQ
jgi:hypothetical protein